MGVAIEAADFSSNAAIKDVSYDTANDEVTLILDRELARYGSAFAVRDDPATSGVTVDFPPADTFRPIVPGSPEGELTIDTLQSGGTVEVTGDVDGPLTVNVDGAGAGAGDLLNILLNPLDNLVGQSGVIKASDVETINVETTNSGDDNPTAASDLSLDALSAETINVSGN